MPHHPVDNKLRGEMHAPPSPPSPPSFPISIWHPCFSSSREVHFT